jgi:glycopeptide antibiotics resistance protein
MRKRLVPALILAAYGALLVKLMVFKDMPTLRLGHLMLNFGGTEAGHPANFVPFATILPYLFGHKGLIIAGINLIGNLILLVPIGFLAPFVYRRMTGKTALMLGVAAGLAIEVLQTILHVGIFDIDDVILNALGVVVGYGVFVVLAAWVHERKYLQMLVAALACIAAALGTLHAIYPHDQPARTGKMMNLEDTALTSNKRTAAFQTHEAKNPD